MHGCTPAHEPRRPRRRSARGRSSRSSKLLVAVAALVGAQLVVGATPAESKPKVPYVDTTGAPVTVRAEPRPDARSVGRIADLTSVKIVCQVRGARVKGTFGTGTLWDKLSTGGFVSDTYVFTDHEGQYLKTCPDGRPTSPGGDQPLQQAPPTVLSTKQMLIQHEAGVASVTVALNSDRQFVVTVTLVARANRCVRVTINTKRYLVGPSIITYNSGAPNWVACNGQSQTQVVPYASTSGVGGIEAFLASDRGFFGYMAHASRVPAEGDKYGVIAMDQRTGRLWAPNSYCTAFGTTRWEHRYGFPASVERGGFDLASDGRSTKFRFRDVTGMAGRWTIKRNSLIPVEHGYIHGPWGTWDTPIFPGIVGAKSYNFGFEHEPAPIYGLRNNGEGAFVHAAYTVDIYEAYADGLRWDCQQVPQIGPSR